MDRRMDDSRDHRYTRVHKMDHKDRNQDHSRIDKIDDFHMQVRVQGMASNLRGTDDRSLDQAETRQHRMDQTW